MSTSSLFVSEGNPVSRETLEGILRAKLPGIQIPDKDKDDYLLLLQALHETLKEVDALPDYEPTTDLDRFPRCNIRRPTAKENPLNAWTMFVHAADSHPEGDILKGMAFAAKDNCAVAGVPTRNGTTTEWIPKMDAVVIQRCLSQGATLIGKATTENNSCSATSHSSIDGPVHNPYCRGRTTAGSSSGCGALVGSGAVDFAIGGDQGGSIRMPASYCGLVGLKPTYGLVPYSGILSLDTTIDHTGPMTTSVMDNARVLAAIAGDDGEDDRQGPGVPGRDAIPMYHLDLARDAPLGISGMRIGIIKESFALPGLSDPRVSDTVLRAVERFKNLGVTVEEVSIPRHLLGSSLWAASMRCSGSLGLTGRHSGRRQIYFPEIEAQRGHWTQQAVDDVSCTILNMIVGGTYTWDAFGPGFYAKVMNLIRQSRDLYDAQLEKYDVLVTPTCPFLPTRHATPGSSPLEMIKPSVGQGNNTAIFNATGHPAISIPVGMLTPNDLEDHQSVKLPVGMQLIGRKFDEATIYRVAYAWEQANDWKNL